jgi:hypothetical protein
MTIDRDDRPSACRIASALILFGLAFGYVEGAVVVVIRALYEPIHAKLRPDRSPGDLFPLITVEELRREDPAHVSRLRMEIGRELATLVMLAAVPWTFARNFREWIAGFMVGFGVWDLVYYATLKGWIGWPDSLLTWDILFLLPVPWSGPVLAPMLVSTSIIVAGLILLRREEIRRPIPLRAWHWALIVLGGSIVIVSFCWDARSVALGAPPSPFPWGVFAAGEVIGLATFAHAGRSAEIESS